MSNRRQLSDYSVYIQGRSLEPYELLTIFIGARHYVVSPNWFLDVKWHALLPLLIVHGKFHREISTRRNKLAKCLTQMQASEPTSSGTHGGHPSLHRPHIIVFLNPVILLGHLLSA